MPRAKSDKELKEDAKHKIENKPVASKKNVVFITDVTQYNHDKNYHPIERALTDFESVAGGGYNIYLQARYTIDQRTISNPRVRKMLVEVFEGDVVPALRAMHDKYPKVVENPDYVCTMQGPMCKDGYLALIKRLAISVKIDSPETLADKWDFGLAEKRHQAAKDKKAAAAEKKAEAAKAKADKAANAAAPK